MQPLMLSLLLILILPLGGDEGGGGFVAAFSIHQPLAATLCPPPPNHYYRYHGHDHQSPSPSTRCHRHYHHNNKKNKNNNWQMFAQSEQENNSNNKEGKNFTTKDKKKNKAATKRRTWDESYEILVEYYKENGDSNVPNHYKQDPKLGKWMQDQRIRKNRMPKDKISKLDAIGFIWDGKVAKKIWGDKKWEEMFQELVQYKEENGDCKVPVQYKPNQELANWVKLQRRSYTISVPSLTPYRIQKLESIGFVWRLKPFRTLQSDIWDEQWEDKYEELVSFKKDHGHCNVPQRYQLNQPLANWVLRQREMNAGTHIGGAVRSDRKEMLDEIGFDWDFEEIRDEAWLSMYKQLKELENPFKENSLGRQTWSSQADQLELWGWEINQQNLYTTGKLDPQREAMMEEIGYWKSIGLKRETTQISQ